MSITSLTIILFWMAVALCVGDEEIDSKTKPVSVRLAPRMMMRIKPNGTKWNILGYGCQGQECSSNCNNNNNNNNNNNGENENFRNHNKKVSNYDTGCKYECSCATGRDEFIFGMSLPTNCEIKSKITCSDVCFHGVCRELCQNIIVKECQTING